MRRNILKHLCFVALAGTSMACGGAQFKATPNQAPQRALKHGTKVEFVDSTDALSPPVLIVGNLTEVTKKGEDDRKGVEKDFKLLAAGKGCDAVVGLHLDTDDQRSTQKVYHKDPDGKVSMAMEEVVTRTYRWQAQCVRSAAADSAAPATKGSAVAPGPGPEPAVVAGDTDPAVQELVGKLAGFEGAYLRLWKDKLHVSTVDPLDAVGATLELMTQVDKFWKITVPMEWLGCKTDPKSDVCQNHAKLIKDLRRADDLKHEMERLDRSASALTWLKKNGNRLAVYLDTFVPAETSDSAMRATPFWTAHQAH
jgi:uncharacterized protein YbjQ (UPF0145 family)